MFSFSTIKAQLENCMRIEKYWPSAGSQLFRILSIIETMSEVAGTEYEKLESILVNEMDILVDIAASSRENQDMKLEMVQDWYKEKSYDSPALLEVEEIDEEIDSEQLWPPLRAQDWSTHCSCSPERDCSHCDTSCSLCLDLP